MSSLLGLGTAGGIAMPSFLGQGCHWSSLSQGTPEDMAMHLPSELGTQRNNTALRQLSLVRRQLTKQNESLLCDSLLYLPFAFRRK